MEMSISDFIKNASDETLMEMAKLTQAEQHKREEQKEAERQKCYTFSGTWAWSCWAANEDEAWTKFNESYIEDLDIDYGHAQVEVDD